MDLGSAGASTSYRLLLRFGGNKRFTVTLVKPDRGIPYRIVSLVPLNPHKLT